MTTSMHLSMFVEFVGVFWGDLLEVLMCDFLHACQVLFNLTSDIPLPLQSKHCILFTLGDIFFSLFM